MTISKPKQVKSKTFNLALTPILRSWIDRKSKEYGMSSASYVRMILLEEKKKQDMEIERL